MALLLATFLFQGGTALSPQQLPSTPTPDRLAKPTLPASPTQADQGAQVFWLYCLPCHGDHGQGLTEEFRQTYPPEDRNCWTSGCHGAHPYRDGFTLPTVVPGLVGDQALNNFPDAAKLYGFISAAMPFQAPATLTSQQYYQLVAFLLRQNGLWDGATEINATNAEQIPISPNTPVPTLQPSPGADGTAGISVWFVFIGLGFIILTLIILKILRNQAKI